MLVPVGQDLVYRVYPLPESVVDCVIDYGCLGKDTERIYIAAMLENLLRDDTGMAIWNMLIVVFTSQCGPDVEAACLCVIAQQS